MQCTCTPTEATEILKDCGFKIGYDRLLQGMRLDSEKPKIDKIFPFGDAFPMDTGHWTYVIYTDALYQFIEEHGGKVKKELIGC